MCAINNHIQSIMDNCLGERRRLKYMLKKETPQQQKAQTIDRIEELTSVINEHKKIRKLKNRK